MRYPLIDNIKRHAILRYALLALVLAVLIITALLLGKPASPATNQGAAPRRANVVLILTDDQSMDMIKYMPYLNSQPHGQWIDFQNAFLNVPLCCPSRATILTGQYSHHTGVTHNDGTPFKDDSTIATWLRGAGYRTGLFGKYLNEYPFRDRPSNYVPPGWDKWVALSDEGRYYAPDVNEDGQLTSYSSAEENYSTDLLARKVTEFIESSNGPFFLQYSPAAPHTPYSISRRHRNELTRSTIEHSPSFNEADVSDKPKWVQQLPLLTADQVSKIDASKKEAIETLLSVDDATQTIVDALIKRKVLDNTVIIFMTDNGYSWFSHRWEKKECEYEECIRTPLLIRYPWAQSRVETRLVQNIDIAPTIADLAGVHPPIKVDGISLVPLLNNSATSWRASLLLRSSSGPARFWGIRTETWKYIELNTGEKELYDLVNDPYELQNVAGRPQYEATQFSLADQLAKLKDQ